VERLRQAGRGEVRIGDEGRETTAFRFGRIHGDLAERRACVNDEEVKLTKLEFETITPSPLGRCHHAPLPVQSRHSHATLTVS
jgi:hypothetical protein